jgi:hypothetical protein
MGSYFSKKPKPKETPFEVLERHIETVDPKTYPTFDKTLDWSKTKHVYSDSFCVKEKYVSYALLSILFGVMICLFFIGSGKKKQPTTPFENGAGPGFDDIDLRIGEDQQ